MTNTLSFTTEQGNDIIVKDSLFSLDCTQQDETQSSFHDLRKLLEKDKKLELHSITLSDYWRKDMIPRGLRISKFPTFGKDDTEFKNKWEAILNKCSKDLMLLLIEEAKKERTELCNRIEEVKQTLMSRDSSEHKTEISKIHEDIEKLSRALARSKIEKFKRDQRDYAEGTVYSWTHTSIRSSKGNRRPRKISWCLPSSAASTSEEELTSSQPFLDNGATVIELAPGKQGGAEKRGKIRQKKQYQPQRYSRRIQNKQ